MRFLWVMVLALLVGCASIYHKRKGWVPEGYSDQQLSPKEYQVSFESYRGEDWQELRELLLYRAAQIGQSQKFARFSIEHLAKKQHYDEQTRQTVTAPFNSTPGIFGSPATPNTAVVLPQHTMDYKIRTITAVIEYSNKRHTGDFSVPKLLKHRPDY